MDLFRARQSGIVAVAVACCALGAPRRARAFDYPEHARITYAGMRLFLSGTAKIADEPPRFEPACAGPNVETDCSDREQFLQTLRLGLDSTRSCPPDRFLAYAPPACFSASDVPALAGDHAGTPLFLKWKWFNDFAKPQDQNPTFQVALRVLWGFAKQAEPPARVLARPSDWSGFVRYLRRYDSRTWGVTAVCREGNWDPLDSHPQQLHACPVADLHPNDFELTRFDSDYVSLGERGHAHFRPGICGPARFVPHLGTDPRSPALDAFSWYLDLHTGALKAASYAASLPDDAARDKWRGTALLLEFYSLHFLEDSMAAGHMQMVAHAATNTLLNTVHDAANDQGVVVRPPNKKGAACVGAPSALTHLTEACAAQTNVRIYGDHYLENQGMAAPGARLTFEWAARLVQLSLSEVWAAANLGKFDGAVGRAFRLERTECACRSALSETQLNADPSQLNPVYAQEHALAPYCRVLTWWGGADLTPEQRLAEINGVRRQLDAFNSIPVPVPLYGQDEIDCASPWINLSHTFKDFGGITISGTLASAVPFRELGAERDSVRLEVGLGIAIPPRRFPAQAELFFRDQVSFNLARNSQALGARYRQLFGTDFGLFIEGSAALAAYNNGEHFAFAGAWDGALGYMGRGPLRQFGVSLGVGYDPITNHHWLASITHAWAH